MCKVFMVPGIKKDKLPLVRKLTEEVSKVISQSEQDGVGYAAITRTGKIYGEKWVNREQAFMIHSNPPIDPVIELMAKKFGDAAKFKTQPQNAPNVYKRYGNLGDFEDTCAVILHARKKTQGDKSVDNTHPFFDLPGQEGEPDTALIHNGTIQNHDEFKKVHSTCDSEILLHQYVENSMHWNPYYIDELANKLVGEYAVGVLTSLIYEDETLPILDVFKSNKDLYSAWIPEIETFAFCTSEYSLETAAKNAGLTTQHVMEIQSGQYMRFNAITGEMLDGLPYEFKLSEKWRSTTVNYGRQTYQGNKPTVTTPPRNVTPITRAEATGNGVTEDDDSSEVVRRNFERNHPSLFTQQFFEPHTLNAEERQFFATLERENLTNHKALRLVATALKTNAQ